MKKFERTSAYDYLRILASFCVIVLHLASQKINSINVYSKEWQVLNFYDGIVRWTVPVFVMISGTLFLSREISLKKIYLRYIPRLAVSYVFWAFTYSASVGYDFREHKIMWLAGHYHMWYVPMCIGLYIMLPIVKQIVINKHVTYYYLLASFIFAFIIPSVFSFTKDFGLQWMESGIDVINDIVYDMNMKLLMGFTAYFVLGYVLSKINLSQTKRIYIYVLGLFGFLFTIVATLYASYQNAKHVAYNGNFTVNVLLESIAVFTAFKYMDYKNEKINKIAAQLAKYSYGAYLVHALIIEKLEAVFHINTVSFYPGLSVPLLGCVVFLVSYAISFILNQIPVVNKYIV